MIPALACPWPMPSGSCRKSAIPGVRGLLRLDHGCNQRIKVGYFGICHQYVVSCQGVDTRSRAKPPALSLTTCGQCHCHLKGSDTCIGMDVITATERGLQMNPFLLSLWFSVQDAYSRVVAFRFRRSRGVPWGSIGMGNEARVTRESVVLILDTVEAHTSSKPISVLHIVNDIRLGAYCTHWLR